MSNEIALRTMAFRILTLNVTIPVAASPASLLSLITAALAAATGDGTFNAVSGVMFCGLKTSGAARAALLIGHATNQMNRYIDIGQDYAPPVRYMDALYVSTTGVGTETATIEVYSK